MIDDELEPVQQNAFAAEVLLVLVNILKLGSSSKIKNQIDDVRHWSTTQIFHAKLINCS